MSKDLLPRFEGSIGCMKPKLHIVAWQFSIRTDGLNQRKFMSPTTSKMLLWFTELNVYQVLFRTKYPQYSKILPVENDCIQTQQEMLVATIQHSLVLSVIMEKYVSQSITKSLSKLPLWVTVNFEGGLSFRMKAHNYELRLFLYTSVLEIGLENKYHRSLL